MSSTSATSTSPAFRSRPDGDQPDPHAPPGGLSSDEAERRLAEVGPNTLPEPPRRSRLRRFADQFRSVLVALLAGAAVVAAAIGDLKDAVVVAVVLLLNGVLGYVQEGKAEQALAALESMLAPRARVLRDGRTVEVPSDELVPDDVVLLDAGDRIPADGRLLEAVRLAVDESSLTGESLPAEKVADDVDRSAEPLAEQHNRGFMNTTVVRGRARLLVTETGAATEMGRIAALIGVAEPGPTPLQVGLHRLGTRLAALAGVAVTVVFAVQMLRGDTLADALLAAVALAVAAVPEGLPAVVTVTLAVGVHRLAEERAIVRRLASVETLGSTTVICSDKTGTLTRNEMTARAVVRGHADFTVSGDGYAAAGAIDAVDGGSVTDLLPLVRAGVLCNEASVGEQGLVGEPTEGALVVLAAKAGLDPDAERARSPRLAEVPFDSATKVMATFHRDGTDVVALVKGAPDVLLARSIAEAGLDGTTRDLDAAGTDRWRDHLDRLAGQGLRVLAVASRRLPRGAEPSGDPDADASWIDQLTLEGLVGILDPPRSEARDAVDQCRTAGIAVKMITGDHAATASAVAASLGIEGRVVTGAELDDIDDRALAEQIDDIGVFARVAPDHKVRLVRALQEEGHVVAMTGDGVNDAAALRTADVGVAMGVTGTEVTKEAADVVLTDDDFATIVTAVERGRAIFDNIVKFVRFQLSTNLGAIGSLLGASLLGLPLPLTAIQVLFVNLIADGPPAMTLGVDPPDRDTMRRPPRRPGEPILSGQRLRRLAFAGGVMTIGTLAVLAFAEARWSTEVATTMAFTTFVLFQVVNVFNVRSEEASVFRRDSLANGKLWLAAGSVAALQLLVVTVGPLQSVFDTTALSLGQWLIAAAITSTVLAAEEIRKLVLRRSAS